MNIIELAKQAGIEDAHFHAPHPGVIAQLERFAALVVANIDPKSFMSWQEGHEAGVAQEREACIKVCMEANVQAMDFTGGTYVGGYFANVIKQRGETK
jgi:hypothetical protein